MIEKIIQKLSTTKQGSFGHASHAGLGGKPNEDFYEAFDVLNTNGEESDYGISVLIVADGVTSEAGSQQASRLAVKTIHQKIDNEARLLTLTSPAQDAYDLLERAMIEADQQIKEAASMEGGGRGMSTTIVVALINNGTLHIVHAGDSRAYLWRDQVLYLLTIDHTFVEEAIRQNKLTREEAKSKANRNVITHFLGPGSSLDIDHNIRYPTHDLEPERLVDCLTLNEGDIILLCTDGLSDKVAAAEMGQILRTNQGQLQQCAERLVGKAIEKQETDNITALLYKVPQEATGASLGQVVRLPLALLVLVLLGIFVSAFFGYSMYAFSSNSQATAAAISETSVSIQEATSNLAVTAPETPASPPTFTPLPTSTPTETPTLKPERPTMTPSPTPSPTISPTATIQTPEVITSPFTLTIESTSEGTFVKLQHSKPISWYQGSDYEICFTQENTNSGCYSAYQKFSLDQINTGDCNRASEHAIKCSIFDKNGNNRIAEVFAKAVAPNPSPYLSASETTAFLYKWEPDCTGTPEECRIPSPVLSSTFTLN